MSATNLRQRIKFALIILIVLIPIIVLGQYGQTPGKIIAMVFYIIAGMVMIYEVLTALQLSKFAAYFGMLIVPVFFLFPYHQIDYMTNNDQALLSYYINTGIRYWPIWVAIIIFSFVPLLVNGSYRSSQSIVVTQLIITLAMLIVVVAIKSFWLLNFHRITSLIYFVGIAIIADTAAYFGGMLWGKKWFGGKKLAPRISPKKTWAGFVVGMVATLAFALPYGYWLGIWAGFDYELAMALIMGSILSLIAPLGDLLFSAIKRKIGVKDFSKLLPGHGGLLDRFDAMSTVMFVATIVIII